MDENDVEGARAGCVATVVSDSLFLGDFMGKSGLIWLSIFAVTALMFLQLPPMMAKQDSVFHTYSALVEVDALARQKYVERIEPDVLVDGAIRGMMFQLDPYSGYIAPNELPRFERRSRGAFEGIGIELGIRQGKLVVIAPIEGGPAARAGVLAGDELLSIDGVDLERRSVLNVEELLAGDVGAVITILVRHPGEDEPQKLSITREHITVRTVRGFRRSGPDSWDYFIDREDRIGYIRVSSFRASTMQQFDEALRELLVGGVRGIILDLRFDPGGLMNSAIAMADRFLSDGSILSTVTRRQAIKEYRATSPGSITEIPIVVLVNSSSASSAEIVAGALQARGRAIVVGERSFGKGSVQHRIELTGHGGAIKLTVAHYKLPDGRIIHRTPGNLDTDNWGILPDIVISLDEYETMGIQRARHALDVGPVDEQVAGTTLLTVDRQLVESLTQVRRMLSEVPVLDQ